MMVFFLDCSVFLWIVVYFEHFFRRVVLLQESILFFSKRVVCFFVQEAVIFQEGSVFSRDVFSLF